MLRDVLGPLRAPHALPRSALLHTRVALELYTRYSGSSDYKSSLHTSSSAEHEQYVAAGVPCVWLLGVARAAWLMHPRVHIIMFQGGHLIVNLPVTSLT